MNKQMAALLLVVSLGGGSVLSTERAGRHRQRRQRK